MSPAATSPLTRKVTGASLDAPAMSAAISAYPSMAELSNGGSGRLAMMSSASTQPSASVMPRWVGGSGRMLSRMSAR